MVDIGNKCCGCGNCANVCPKSCIEMRSNSSGFLFPVVDQEACIRCGKCEKSCPVLNTHSESGENTAFFAAINKNKDERAAGSSGGFFPVLAEYVLEQGGVVFGAAFDEGAHRLRHVFIEKKEELKSLRGSKYIQSDLEQSFSEAERFLKDGRTVLFTGTPCNIAALHSYIGHPYPNLITMDVICHGVASPLLWNKYTEELEARYKSKIKNVAFRDKKYGWRAYSMNISFQNGKVYRKFFKQDPFGKAYLSNVMLRSSCFDCSFKTVQRPSDFTAGDFWSNGRLMTDDDGGISLILIHSDRGKKIWGEINNRFEYKELSKERAVNGNTPLYESTKCDLNMSQFYNGVFHEGFEETVKTVVPDRLTVKQRMRYIAKVLGLK